MAVFSLGEQISNLDEVSTLLEDKNFPMAFEITGSHFLDDFDSCKRFATKTRIRGLCDPIDYQLLKQLLPPTDPNRHPKSCLVAA